MTRLSSSRVALTRELHWDLYRTFRSNPEHPACNILSSRVIFLKI